MAGKFKVSKVTNFKEFNVGDELSESDFSILTSDDKFIQFNYESIEKQEVRTIAVEPGIWAIAEEKMRIVLRPTDFTSQSILDDYLTTKEIEDKVDTFFSRLHIYEKLKIDAKRAALLYGPPGAGKSVTLAKIAKKYAKNNDTTIVLWPSDKFEARHVKDFLGTFDYKTNNIKKLILIIEDLGGVEQNAGQRYSEASLLSLLDNVENTFTIPTAILATTNFPEMFLENLTNRPQRFDDVIEIKRPPAEARSRFLEFFSGGALTQEQKAKIEQKKYDVFSVAHLKEVVVRSMLYDISLENAIDRLFEQAERATKNFSTKKSSIGFYE